MISAKLAITLFFVLVGSAYVVAQSSAETAHQESSTAASTADLPEISTQEQMPAFHVKVNLVQVRVVVRDSNGKAIGNLTQEDFVLYDEKKPQTIARFSVEGSDTSAGSNVPAATTTVGTSATPPAEDIRQQLAKTSRLAYLFDDVNSTANGLTNARKAAERAIDGMAAGELLGIFTLSGQGTQDFTSDKERLRAAVAQLQPRPQGASVVNDCPPINYYIADRLTNSAASLDQICDVHKCLIGGPGGADEFQVVLQQVIACQFDGNYPQDPYNNPQDRMLLAQEANAAKAAIKRVYRAGEAQSDFIFQSINQVLRHVSQFGGQRTIVFLSPGFYIGMTRQADLTDSLNRAIAQGVVIDTLDLRGVVAPTTIGTDISQKASGSTVYGPEMIRQQAGLSLAQGDTLLQMANATGGRNLRNSNDLVSGLAELSAPPEVSYMLAFAPHNLQNDGKFHALRVELKQPSGYTVQARKGYYAPLPEASSEQVRREIAEAVFAQDEIHELPLHVQMQFFRSLQNSATVSVLVHIDVRQMQFKKTGGRNLNELTVVAAIFDRNANLVTAKSNTVKMHIKDETLSTKLNSGITVRNNFDVKPGGYMVRVVARDEQGKMLTQNEVVDIP